MGQTDERIAEMVVEVLEDDFELERERIVPEAHLFDDLELDSLDIVDLVVAMQVKFGVQIREDERIVEVRTVADLQRFILLLKRESEAT
ncbi:MAG: acyl carrier protein [Deltaproteobacteria bacterium]|nr:acyl carrier protein [Deltaproteobacteria bacterium]MBM4268542.1 acyl carrier protein [Deltaproteobacteria bacterium]